MVLKVEGVIQHGASAIGSAPQETGGALLGATCAPAINLACRTSRKRKAGSAFAASSAQPDRPTSTTEEKRHRNIRKVVVTVKTSLQSKAASVMEMNLKPEITNQTLSRSVVPQNDYFCQQVCRLCNERLSGVRFLTDQ